REPDPHDEDLPAPHPAARGAGAPPARVLPVRRTGLRARRQLRVLRGARLFGLQAVRLDRDPAVRHGAPERAARRRHRSRGVHRLRVRHGAAARRDAALRHRRHPPVPGRGPALPRAVRRGAAVKVSLRWLGRHVDVSDKSPQQVLEDLTMSTAEVEGIEEYAAGLDGVVVGHVLARERHPDADKLSVTSVDVGRGEPLQVVCGAPNVAAGQRVAVVLPGAALPDGTRIKKSKIRGVESFGMICSEKELGLGDASAGILVLPDDTAIGRPLTEALDLRDHVLEIDNKSINHRPDLWGHYGLARELAAIWG